MKKCVRSVYSSAVSLYKSLRNLDIGRSSFLSVDYLGIINPLFAHSFNLINTHVWGLAIGFLNLVTLTRLYGQFARFHARIKADFEVFMSAVDRSVYVYDRS